jgi:hypothetical protein
MVEMQLAHQRCVFVWEFRLVTAAFFGELSPMKSHQASLLFHLHYLWRLVVLRAIHIDIKRHVDEICLKNIRLLGCIPVKANLDPNNGNLADKAS